ncbi:MAG: internal scaffolding protein [Microviridae sp.]|nr:MAG: internal scaffolding protein [Microviridae sp.]
MTKSTEVTDKAITGRVPGCGTQPRVRPPWCRARSLTINNEPSMTQESHFDSTDVNAIVARFERTGLMPENVNAAQYGDVTGLQEHELTELINKARSNKTTAEEFIKNWKPPQEPTMASNAPSEQTIPPSP